MLIIRRLYGPLFAPRWNTTGMSGGFVYFRRAKDPRWKGENCIWHTRRDAREINTWRASGNDVSGLIPTALYASNFTPSSILAADGITYSDNTNPDSLYMCFRIRLLPTPVRECKSLTKTLRGGKSGKIYGYNMNVAGIDYLINRAAANTTFDVIALRLYVCVCECAHIRCQIGRPLFFVSQRIVLPNGKICFPTGENSLMYSRLQIGLHTFCQTKLRRFKFAGFKATADVCAVIDYDRSRGDGTERDICEIWKKEFLFSIGRGYFEKPVLYICINHCTYVSAVGLQIWQFETLQPYSIKSVQADS